MANVYKAYLTILFPYRLIDYEEVDDVIKLKTTLELQAREKFLLIKEQVSSMNHLSFEFLSENWIYLGQN